jgi:acid stress chaperone HdeB
MHRHGLVVLGLAAALAVPSSASAQVMADLSKITCEQFIKYKVTDPKLIAAWFNGYFHGKRGDTMVDTQKLNADADEVEKFCFKNHDALVMQSAESIIGGAN